METGCVQRVFAVSNKISRGFFGFLHLEQSWDGLSDYKMSELSIWSSLFAWCSLGWAYLVFDCITIHHGYYSKLFLSSRGQDSVFAAWILTQVTPALARTSWGGFIDLYILTFSKLFALNLLVIVHHAKVYRSHFRRGIFLFLYVSYNCLYTNDWAFPTEIPLLRRGGLCWEHATWSTVLCCYGSAFPPSPLYQPKITIHNILLHLIFPHIHHPRSRGSHIYANKHSHPR